MLFEHLDLRLGEHAPVTHQNHPLQGEAPLELPHLIGHRARVPGVPGIDFDGHGSPLHIGQYPIDHDRLAPLAVAAVSEAHQRTGVALVVAAAHVVEYLLPFIQVTARQALLDARLALQQPVHGRIQRIFVRILHLQHLRQRRAVPQPRGRQFRTRHDQPFDDHRQHQVALARALGADQLIQPDLADRLQHRFDMTVGPGTFNGERLFR